MHPPVELERFAPGPVRRPLPRALRADAAQAHRGRRASLQPPGLAADRGRQRARRAPPAPRIAGPNVRFEGRVSATRAPPSCCRGARALVVTATEEFGIAAVEAQAAGRPVIALAEGGVLETVQEGETGAFYDRPDAESLIEAVDRLRPDGHRPGALRGQRRPLRPVALPPRRSARSSPTQRDGARNTRDRRRQPRRTRGLAPLRPYHRGRRPARQPRSFPTGTGCAGCPAVWTRSPPRRARRRRPSSSTTARPTARSSWLAEPLPEVRVLELGRNTGFAHAANRGIEAAEAEAVALVNTDVELTPDWLERLAAALEARPAARPRWPARWSTWPTRRVCTTPATCCAATASASSAGRFELDDGRFDAPGEVFAACAGRGPVPPRGRARGGRLRRALLHLPGGRRPRAAPAAGRVALRL